MGHYIECPKCGREKGCKCDLPPLHLPTTLPVADTKIDKGIPIPPPHKRQRLTLWSRLEVGDSFVVANHRLAKARQSSACHHGIRLTYRPQYDGTYRLWRIK